MTRSINVKLTEVFNTCSPGTDNICSHVLKPLSHSLFDAGLLCHVICYVCDPQLGDYKKLAVVSSLLKEGKQPKMFGETLWRKSNVWELHTLRADDEIIRCITDSKLMLLPCYLIYKALRFTHVYVTLDSNIAVLPLLVCWWKQKHTQQ